MTDPAELRPTDRLLLRPLSKADLEGLAELFSHELVYRHLCDGQAPPSTALREWLDASEELRARDDVGLLVARRRDARPHEALVGLTGMMESYDPPVLELVVAVRPELQRMGYASEMVGAVIELLRQSGRHERIRASTDQPNVASRALLTRLGFEEVGDSRPAGVSEPQIHYVRSLGRDGDPRGI